METRPGSKAQRLHRDNKNFHTEHVDQTGTGYRVGADNSMGFLIPGVETTIENGATLVRQTLFYLACSSEKGRREKKKGGDETPC